MFPQIFLLVQSWKESLCIIEMETEQKEKYKHKNEIHMWITEPFVSVFHSLQITQRKACKIRVSKINPRNDTIWTDENNMREMDK